MELVVRKVRTAPPDQLDPMRRVVGTRNDGLNRLTRPRILSDPRLDRSPITIARSTRREVPHFDAVISEWGMTPKCD